MEIRKNDVESITLQLLRLVCALLTLAVASCAVGQTVRSYPARGVVEQIAPDHRQVTIHHQAIPGYMMEMTMGFPVQNTDELNGISPGDKITFTLVVSQTNDWVENIRRTGRTAEIMTNAMPRMSAMPAELKPGDLLPDGEMTAEDGRRLHFSDFRGQALAFTFFFTRCPLPNYCPLMNRNFAAARDLILSMPYAPTNWEFLSISFDPGYDTPETLSNYAQVYRGENTNHWLFAAASTNTLVRLAPRLDLIIMRQGNNISHNLRTVVIDPQGRIYKQFDGNQWTPQDLADAVLKAARKP
jgi:protein SCO1